MDATENALRDAIAAAPQDHCAKLAYADYLGERCRPEEEAWRWIAAFRRRPCPFRMFRVDGEPYWESAPVNWNREEDLSGGWGWRRWDFRSLKWPDSAGYPTLPKEVFRHLPSVPIFPDGCYDAKPYHTVRQAFESLVTAYISATSPRSNMLSRLWYGEQWVPDWKAAERVPEGE